MLSSCLLLLFCGPTPPVQDAEIVWTDARSLTIEGQGWTDTAAPWDRLPAQAESLVRPAVWSLSRHSAGIAVRFVTDATTLHARWALTSSRLAMPHMPATGVSGLDLYARDDNNRWRWVTGGRPEAQENTVVLVTGLRPGKREYLLYLPLYNGTSSVAVGVPAGSQLLPGPERPVEKRKPIVFYGTSITHGGCASRPGMVHTAILGRWFDRPVVNLGFSGNGRMEPEVARLMAELDAAVFVVDCLPNITAAEVTQRTAEVVRILRDAHPDAPIVLVEDRNYTNGYFIPAKARRNRESQQALQAQYQALLADGVKHLYYIRGADLLGDDGEATVDSSHPTDLGFMRQARAFEKVLRPILP